MQNYTPMGDTKKVTGKQALLNHEDNIASVRSSNSGTAFPTENLTVGMTCYRTDQETLYVYNGTTWLPLYAVCYPNVRFEINPEDGGLDIIVKG